MAAVSIVPGGRAVARESRQRVSVVQSYNFGGVPYEGPYEAVPSWQEQTLATANRVMRNDLSIEAIVKLEVINDSGGLTLTI